jgi:hypothetical protein
MFGELVGFAIRWHFAAYRIAYVEARQSDAMLRYRVAQYSNVGSTT